MEHVEISQRPALKDAVLIAAFAGWNDAAEVATSAVKFLAREWATNKFAAIQPEEFYVFTETRPHVRLTAGGSRRIDWPANEFSYREPTAGQRDIVLLVGSEPQLRWRKYVKSVLDVAREANVTTLITLGGLIADVPHSRPARITGSSNVPELSERLGRMGVHGSRYEGPTGIVGVLNSTAGEQGLATASMWGNVPHYVSSSMNPKVIGGLLERLDTLLGLDLDLTEWRAMTRRFDDEIADALASNPQIAAYVRELEAREPLEELEAEPPAARGAPSDLPDSEEIVRELEEFLRENQEGDEDER